MADQSTIVEIPLTSTTRSVTIPFDYLTRSAVVLTIKRTDDVTFEKVLVLTDDYRFTGLTEVTLNGDYSGFGDRLEIKRHTPATRLVDFRDGSVLTANSLNISQLQAIHIAEEGRFEITTEIREATADAQRFAKQAEASANDSKTYRDATQKIWDGILDSIEAAGDKSTLGYLATPAGFSAIGGFISFDALRLSKPQHEGQRVKLDSYVAGKFLGGGEFVGHLTTATDDGGTIAAGPSHHWKRTADKSELNVTHFGAVMDGVTDDMPAIVKMHNWSRSVNLTFGPGIVIPAGKIAVGYHEFGDTEIPAFKMRGPQVAYGRIPSLEMVPVDKTDTRYHFNFRARRMEISNIYFNGVGSKCGFMENRVTRGDYCRIYAVQARDVAGKMFHVWDTIDTKLDQCYSSRGGDSFFRTDWSNENPGAWDHPTAIEISNCNFEAHTGDYAVSCIRAGQSEMNNCWFDRNDRGFDISQGGWIIKNVTQENSKYPSGAQWSKLVIIQSRFAQGAGLDRDTSGYDPSWDPSGKPPSWVDSVYERGWMNMDARGFIQYGGSFSMGYESSQYKVQNMTGNPQWFEIGTLGLTGATAKSVIIELNGAGQFDSAIDNPRPGSTNFGAGKATLFVQQKDQANGSKMPVSWYGEGACPISEVRVDNSNKNRPRIFAKMKRYCGGIAVTFRTNDKSNFEGGQHFYLSTVMANVEAGVAEAFPKAPGNWSINGENNYGLGFNTGSGRLTLDGPAPISDHAAGYLPIEHNGITRYLPMQPQTQSFRLARYARAELPAADGENAYGLIMCTDSGAGSGAATAFELLYSDGLKWCRSKDGSAVSRT